MTGLCLGATVSVKWVGLFTIGWVGSLTILQLWVMLGDTTSITPVGDPRKKKTDETTLADSLCRDYGSSISLPVHSV